MHSEPGEAEACPEHATGRAHNGNAYSYIKICQSGCSDKTK